MDVEFQPIQLGEKIAVEMPTFYWVELLVWAGTLEKNVGTSCTAIEMLNVAIWEKITTPAFQKAFQAQEAEQMEQHPIARIIRHIKEVHGDDDVI